MEVLERIFQFVVAPLPVELQMRATRPPQVAWAWSLAQVCSQWRAIVLRSPDIWYHVIDHSGQFIKRPRDMNPHIPSEIISTIPLHVYIDLPRLPSAFTPRQPPGLHRIREVYLRIDRAKFRNTFNAYTGCTFPPNIQLMTITSTEKSGYRDPSTYREDLPLIFGGDTPNLKALVADIYAPFLPGNAFPNLVNLRISCIPHLTVGFTLLLQLFSHTACLETLELLLHTKFQRDVQHAMETTGGLQRLDAWTTRIPLPRLRALTVSGLCVQTAMAVLSKLDVPSHVVIRLSRLQLLQDSLLYTGSACFSRNGRCGQYGHLRRFTPCRPCRGRGRD